MRGRLLNGEMSLISCLVIRRIRLGQAVLKIIYPFFFEGFSEESKKNMELYCSAAKERLVTSIAKKCSEDLFKNWNGWMQE